MGLLDVLNGMQNGPRGPSNPSAQAQRRNVADDHGDPRTARLQGGQTSHRQPARRSAGARAAGTGAMPACRGGGMAAGLAIVLKGGLGGLLAGGAAGSVISGGLGDLLKQFQQSGHGDTANSWVGPGPNKQISPGDLANALGADQINSADVAKRPVARRTARRASASICPT